MSSSINWQSTKLANTNCQVVGPDSNIVDVFIEIKKGKANNSAIFLIGSWDNWIGKIRMKYSHFTNSFLAVLSLPISSKINEYEFLFTNGDPRDFGYHVSKYRNRSPSKTLKKGRVNFVKLNFTTQNGNRNSTSIENKDLLGKILMVDNSLAKLIKRVKTDVKRQNFLGQTMKKIKQKYSKIRDKFSSQLQINPQQMKALIDLAIRAHAYAIILFLLYDWAKLEKESAALKKSKNAVTIRVEFMNKLQQFVMTKEEVIHQFKRTFCHPLLNECRRQIGLGEESMEIRKLKTFLKRWEDEKRPKKEDKIDEKKMKKEQQVEKKALTEMLMTQRPRQKNNRKKEIIRRNNVDWSFLRQKVLRKKTFERRMKSRIMEKNKFNKKKATTEMIMEGWNEKWWIENRNKGQKEAKRKAMELANKQKLMNEVNEKMKEESHRRICLKEGSSEILQLKTFLDANFCA